MTDTVTVPRELLRWVLIDADATANGIANVARMQKHQRAINATKAIRDRIAELRRIAGLDEEHDR